MINYYLRYKHCLDLISLFNTKLIFECCTMNTRRYLRTELLYVAYTQLNEALAR